MSDPLPVLPLDDIPLWLAKSSLDGASVEAILAGFVRRLNAHGFGVGRAYMGTRLLNPLIHAQGYIYDRKSDEVIREVYEHGDMPDEYERSPIYHMITRNEYHLYRVLAGPEAVLDFDIIRDFAARGYTAWSAHLIPFTILEAAPRPEDPLGFVITACCNLPSGWTKDHELAFDRLLPHLSAAIQGRVFATLAHDLLTTYLGGDAALRVLGGTTTRGDLRTIRAAILYADLRGFTARAEILDPATLLASLDRHFDRLVGPIEAENGQVLKFMGDGLLAIFPVDATRDNGGGDAEAARAAFAAARHALAANAELAGMDAQAMPVDIALHIGDVLYGNVGGASRLDFTVIGPAVNAAARLEQQCKALDVPLIVSAEIAQHLDGTALRALGQHSLRGIAGAKALFTLA